MAVGACRVRLYRCIAQFTRGWLKIQILPVVGRRGVVWGRKGIQKLIVMNVLRSTAVPVWFTTVMAQPIFLLTLINQGKLQFTYSG